MKPTLAMMLIGILASEPALAMGHDDLTCSGFTNAEASENPNDATPYMIVVGESAGATAMAITTSDVGNAFVKLVTLLGTSTQSVCLSNPDESLDDALKVALAPIVADMTAN